jgi:hypothetical protein
MTDHTGLPADAGLDKEIAPVRSVTENLHMLDVGDARNLCDGVL